MNLNDYLIENNRDIGDVALLFSVGTALDKVSGDTFPMLVGGKIDFDKPMNLMDMPISGDTIGWFDSLAFGEKEVVDEVLDELAYESFSKEELEELGLHNYVMHGWEGLFIIILKKEELELYNSVPPCSSMTPVKEGE